jgi:ribonucleoside-diphosphate reductase alpha chain
MSGGAKRNRRQYRLIHNFHYGETNSKKYAIHHIDYNSKNDSIDNLKVMLHEEHRRLHADGMMGTDNPYFKMTDSWKKDFASHPGKRNGRYSGHSNEVLITEGRKVFLKHGKFTGKLWQIHAKKIGAPQFVGNEFRFGTWNNFKSVVVNNHKVAYVKKIGTEDVYNITVDDHHNYNIITSYEAGFVKSSGICVKNCGEIILSPYDSCRLMLVNLTSFVKNEWASDAEFNYGHFAEVVQKAQRLMDDMIDLEIEQIDKILKKIDGDPEPDNVKYHERSLWHNIKQAAINGRRTGLGITGLGDTLAMMGIVYGTEAAIKETEEIYKWLALNSYDASIQLAKERGSFPVFDFEKENNHPFISRIIDNLIDEKKDDYEKYGRRNIANTTTAPAGSVSCLTQTTSGIEPAFMLCYKRRKKINPNDETAVVSFVDDLGDKWSEFIVYHHGFEKWKYSLWAPDDLSRFTDEHLVKLSPYCDSTANEIDWQNKVRMQAAAQKWVCHAISNTTNLPEDIDIETVKKVYELGWKTGCKGITVYREGSRTGVLVSNKKEEPEERNEIKFAEHQAPKRPDILKCDIYQSCIKSEDWTILVGLLNGKPYEVIGGLSEFVQVPRKYKNGELRKRARKTMPSKYDLICGDKDDPFIIKDTVAVFDNPNNGSFTRTLSLVLRHGAPIQFVVEQLQKDKNEEMFSFSRVIARCLKNYIKDGTKSSNKVCDSCGSEDSIIYQEGCTSCKVCGNSKCG